MRHDFYFLLQEYGESKIIIGIISRRPISMTRVSIILDITENPEKLFVGPTAPRPGPTLLIQVSAAVMLVSNPKPSKEIIIDVSTKMIK